MPERRPTLLGGPLDGSTIAPGQRPAFIYCAPAPTRNGVRRATVFTAPKAGRELYRELEVGVFVYAGHTHRRCDGCGAYLKASSKTCGLCGALSTVLASGAPTKEADDG